jgi:predicted TIM-barrel fold metal-dependent hydrolase
VCVRAYNDWMIEEWCGARPGRLIPMIILPLWDADLAVAEAERGAANGARAVTFSENPAALGLPSVHDRTRYWDPVFAVCADAGMPVCTHIGSSSKLPHTSDDAPPLVTATLPSTNSAAALADWLFSGLFVRHPGLKLCLSEGGIGWIPAIVERADYVFERYGPRLKSGTGFGLTGMGSVDAGSFNDGAMDVLPSELFRDHVFGCFIEDHHGSRSIHEVGIDNVMVECDYPHGDSTWPDSLGLLQRQLAHLDGQDREKVLAGNARRVFGLEARVG